MAAVAAICHDPAVRELVLHVGVHKTGSTLLQRVLVRSAAALEQQGLRFVPRRRLYALPRVRAVTHGLQNGKDIRERDLETVAADVRALLHGERDETVLVSDETFLAARVDLAYPGPLYSSGIAPLRWFRDSIVPPAPMRVVMFVRRQDRFIESMYVQLVHQGRTERFDDWYATLDIDRFDWLATARAIEDLVGVDNLVVRPFELIHAGTVAFCTGFLALVAPTLRLPLTSAEIEDIAQHANRSLSARGVEVALRAYPLLELDERVALRRSSLQPYLSNRDFPRAAPMPESAARSLLQRHAAANAELSVRCRT